VQFREAQTKQEGYQMKKKLEIRKLDNGGRLMISVQSPTGETGAKKKTDPLLELERREELLRYMDDCRSKYVQARDRLATMAPGTVDQFEKELALQKQTTLHRYDA
jgi:hypothetical protein